jgi:PAS domain S-box-containing protein
MPGSIDNRILSQLMLLQGTLDSMPTDESISRFVVRGLKSVPGVRSLNVCVRGAVAEKNDLCSSCSSRWGVAEYDVDYPCKLEDHGHTKCFPIRSVDRLYGFIVFSLNDTPDAFAPYEPYLQNIVNVIAISIDNKQQRQALEAFNEQLQGEVEHRKQTAEALRESEEKFRLFFENAVDGMLLMDLENHRINNANDSMSQMLGYSLEELKQLGAADIHPKEELPYVEEQIEIQLNDGLAPARDLPMRRKDGSVFHANVRGAPIVLSGRKYLMGVFRDITERRQAEEIVQASLREKEILLKEVHHRIKNNMSSMMSLLSLQSSTLKNPEAVAALLEARDRMRSMGVLYDKLYRSENLREMSIKAYLPALVDEIVGVFPNRGLVKVEKRIDDIILGVKVLSPLGIIVNELITNAMKHAFGGRDDGSISISASAKKDHLTLVIEDNGNGIPESVDIANSDGFGLQLVGMLTAQLDGTLRIERRKGARFVLEFDA